MAKNDQYTRLSGIFKAAGVLFCIILVSVIFQILKIRQIRYNWQETTGFVIKASSKGWWNEERQRRYYLEYRYEINNKRFSNVQFHIKERSLKRYKHFIKNFKKGDAITVWYNPDNLDQSVINVEYLRNGFIILIIFTGFLVMIGTMILKESRWQKQADALASSVPEDYNGTPQLPSSDIINDNGDCIRLNTGMSIFWNFGIPFLAISFLSILPMFLLMNEINPGWRFPDYMGLVTASWGLSLAGGLLVKKGFSNTLEIDAKRQKIKERSVTLFKHKTTLYDFSDIHELRLYREKWRYNNPLRNWMLYLQTRSKHSLFIAFRHRDVQPLYKNYLSFIKRRLENLINGEIK